MTARPCFLTTAGIGKAIAKKLAGQQLSVVLVALHDQLLDATHEELSALYPDVTIRKARNSTLPALHRTRHAAVMNMLHACSELLPDAHCTADRLAEASARHCQQSLRPTKAMQRSTRPSSSRH